MGEYHIRRRDREITDREVMIGIMKSVKYLVVAMADGNESYLVTLSCGYSEEENAFYFHCAREGRKLDVIAKNPRVLRNCDRGPRVRQGRLFAQVPLAGDLRQDDPRRRS